MSTKQPTIVVADGARLRASLARTFGHRLGHAAIGLGLAPSTLSRILNGRSKPGPRFIAAVLTNLPVSFNDVFEVVEA
jgi:hypothetical protein